MQWQRTRAEPWCEQGQGEISGHALVLVLTWELGLDQVDSGEI